MKNSSCRGLEVFDFKEEDEDLAATKILGKFRNPNMEDHSVLKYKFLECVASVSNISTRKTGDVPCVDIDTLDDDHGEDDHMRNTSLSTIREENATKESNDRRSFALQFDSLGDLNNQEYGRSFAELEMRTSSPVASSAGRSQSNCDPSESLSNNKSVDLNSDADDDNINEPASSVASEDEEDVSLDGHTSDYCLGNQLVGSDKALVLFPEYAIYRGRYYTEPLLAFSPGCIKFTGSTTCLQAKSFTLECSLDDIVNISCQWSPKVEMVLIKINIISKDELQTEDMQEPSGIEELKFAVVDAHWSGKQEMIRGLHVKYAAVWDVVVDLGMGVEGVDAEGQRHYFPDFDEPFEDFVYPKGDSDAVSISKRDVDLLQPETFINDTIIDFYIKYLKNQIQHEERRRFHFFNSFFFRKLADLDKDPSSASDGRAAFLRVRKWTRKINLFEKDYIFIPVNYNLHWSLIVICHPGEVANFGSEDLIKSTKLPCILHMDSIRGSHTGLKNLVQSYLWEEWKEKGNENSEQISERFSNMRFVHLELPQQENSYDCGLFLLHYLELFLTQAPLTFNPLKISKFSRFLNADWFPPVEASLKRTVIQKLIYELLGGQSQDVAYPACGDRNLSKTAETKTEDGFSRESLVLTSPVVACQSVPQACNGIEISSQVDSSLRNSQNANNESGLVLREFFEPGPTAGSFLGSCQSFNQQSYYRLNNSISALETEDVEMGAAFGYKPYGGCGEADFRGTNGVSPQTAGILFGSHVDDEVVDSPDASPQASDGSSDIAIYETSINNNNTDLGDDFERYETPQAENIEHFVGIASSSSAEVVLETVDVKGRQESKAEVEIGSRDIVDEESIMQESKSEVMLDTRNVVDKVTFFQEGKLEVGLETMDADGVMQENQEQQRVLHPESPGSSSHHEEETVLCPEVENANTELQSEIGVGGSKSEQVVTEYVIPDDPEDEKPDAKRRRLLDDGDLHL